MLQAQDGEATTDAKGAAADAFAFEPYATQGIATQRLIEEGVDEHCLLQRITDYKYRKDGTFELVERVNDGTGLAHLQVRKAIDSSGHVIGYERTLGEDTHRYGFEHDALGRVTKITRADNSIVEHSYHGLSNHATELKVDGRVVATQKVANPSILTSRKVGGRAYSFTANTVTLPDKTALTTHQSANGLSFKASDHALCSLTQQDGTLTLASAACDAVMKTGWAQAYRDMNLPGRQRVTQTSPRAGRKGYRWQSLRGRPLASLRADGHWQRVFINEQGRVIRTCQDHEEVVHRYDSLGRLQSRQAQALKVGGQWQVLSEHDNFGQEVTRRFLHNGSECFKQCMTWRGDGRLASKASYRNGTLLRTERFAYDVLDRLQRYDCEASAAEHCPQDAQGKAVKAQVFSWDALSNLTRCVTTCFDDTVHIEDLAYGTTSDPTRLTEITRDTVARPLVWNTNGCLINDGREHCFSYNAVGQLDKVSSADGTLLARYEYDGSQRLAAQYLKGDECTRELRYDGDELIGEVRYDKAGQVSQTTSLSNGLAQYDEHHVRWLIDDPQVGVAGQLKDGALELAPLLPFGEGKALDGLVNGYNGMRRDPLTGHYHAGNGYRSYDPALRRYAQPDWLSPFGEGGLNDYAHCPDPVNLHDPSGAIMLSRWDQNHLLATYEKAVEDTQKMPVGSRWRSLLFSGVAATLGIALTFATGGLAAPVLAFVTMMSVASFAFEVVAVLTEDSNPQLSRAMGIASVATGVLSTLGFVGVIKAGLKGLQLLAKGVRMIGKGAKAVWNGAKNLWRARFGGAGIVRPLGQGRFSNPIRVGGPRGYAWAGGLHDSANLSNISWTGNSGAPHTMGGLRGAITGAWGYLGKVVTMGENAVLEFAPGGWLAKADNLVHTLGMQPFRQAARMWQSAEYAFFTANTVLEANILKGTIESSISLEESRLAARVSESAQRAAPTSVRGGGSYAATQVFTPPMLAAVKKHKLPPAGLRVKFW